jgi:hypothetical protein
MLFNSGDFTVTMDMGKLVDDDKAGVQFRSMVSLNDLYSNFYITQSLFEPFMTLSIHISEAKMILERFGTRGLQGEEFVKIKFSTPGAESHVIEDLFYVTGYSPIKKDSHDLQTGLILKCVSKEKLINDMMTVNQSFTGSTSDVAKTIFNNKIIDSPKYKQMKTANAGGEILWKQKDIVVDTSVGTQKFIIPGLTPFKALHFLAVRSFGGSKFPSSFYTFYEAEDAFHFGNIENWENRISNKEYTYDSELGALPKNHKDYYSNIKYISPLVIKNTMAGIQNGEFANKVTSIDFNRKSFFVTNFNMGEDRNKFKLLGPEFNMSSNFFDTFGNDPVESTIAIDSTKSKFNENFGSIVGKRMAYQQMLGHYSLQIVINGDSSMTVGEVIKLDLKESGAQENKQRGSMYSGSWLITKCDHIADNGLFNTKLTIVKDGLKFTHSEEN